MFLLLLTTGMDDNERKLITEIYYEYRELMVIVAKRYVKDENSANDIIQDAFFRIRDHVIKISSLPCNKKRAYIVNIVKSISVDYLRVMKRQRTRVIPLHEMKAGIKSKEISTEEYLQREELRLEISRLMIQLTEKEAFLLKAKYYHGYSTQEIGEMMNIESESTVRSMIFRARKKVIEMMDESEVML